jgi:excisionase family DNA binding protein
MREISNKGRDELLRTTASRNEQTCRTPALEPLTVTISETSRITGISRSEIYRRLAKKEIFAIKSGSRTLVLMDSVRQHLNSQPLATFRAAKGSD